MATEWAFTRANLCNQEATAIGPAERPCIGFAHRCAVDLLLSQSRRAPRAGYHGCLTTMNDAVEVQILQALHRRVVSTQVSGLLALWGLQCWGEGDAGKEHDQLVA